MGGQGRSSWPDGGSAPHPEAGAARDDGSRDAALDATSPWDAAVADGDVPDGSVDGDDRCSGRVFQVEFEPAPRVQFALWRPMAAASCARRLCRFPTSSTRTDDLRMWN